MAVAVIVVIADGLLNISASVRHSVAFCAHTGDASCVEVRSKRVFDLVSITVRLFYLIPYSSSNLSAGFFALFVLGSVSV